MRSLTCSVSQIATLGCFSLAVPTLIPAPSPGGNAIVNVRTVDARNRVVVASVGPVGGGAGGTPRHDGPDGSGGLSAFLKNTPVEVNEAEVPILIHRYGLQPDTAGPGRHRGGLAAVMEFGVSAPDTVVTARNRNRSIFAAPGIMGGRPGANSTFTTNPGRPDAVEHGNKDVIRCGPGDVVRIVGPGAGGYGPPAERDPEAVLQDWRCGYVSVGRAREDYAVVVVDGAVDLPETARLREGLPAWRGQHFDHGAARAAFEALWTRDRYGMLTAFLSGTPVPWRHFLKHRVFARLAAQAGDGGPSDGQMAAIFEEIREEYPALGEGGSLR